MMTTTDAMLNIGAIQTVLVGLPSDLEVLNVTLDRNTTTNTVRMQILVHVGSKDEFRRIAGEREITIDTHYEAFDYWTFYIGDVAVLALFKREEEKA